MWMTECRPHVFVCSLHHAIRLSAIQAVVLPGDVQDAQKSCTRKLLLTFLSFGSLQLVGYLDRMSSWRFKDKIDLFKRQMSEFGEVPVGEEDCTEIDRDEKKIDLGDG